MKTEYRETFKDFDGRKLQVIAATSEGERYYMHNEGGPGWTVYRVNHLGIEVKQGFSNSKPNASAEDILARMV